MWNFQVTLVHNNIPPQVWVHPICSSSSESSFLHIHLYLRCRHYNGIHRLTTTISGRLLIQGVSPLINHRLWYHFLVIIRSIHIRSRAIHKCERYHIFTQNLKVIGVWALLLIKCSTSTFLTNVPTHACT